MPLSQKIIDDSLFILLSNYYNQNYTDKGILCLHILNALAAENDLVLGYQSPEVINLIFSELTNISPQLPHSSIVQSIYSLILNLINLETCKNKLLHQSQGKFDARTIDQRDMKDQLHDEDMTLLMPKSDGAIEIFAPLNRFDSSTNVIQQAIIIALKHKKINRIIVPIGPDHWRGVYLSKPVNDTDNYLLELFDPYGPTGTGQIKEFTLTLLKKSGIPEQKITIKTTGPTFPQKDNYSCGDYTCAYSHKKMKEFGAANTAYNAYLINVLEYQGNNGHFLREAIRELSKEMTESKTNPQKNSLSAQKLKNVPATYESSQMIKERKATTPKSISILKLTNFLKKNKLLFLQSCITINDEKNIQCSNNKNLMTKNFRPK